MEEQPIPPTSYQTTRHIQCRLLKIQAESLLASITASRAQYTLSRSYCQRTLSLDAQSLSPDLLNQIPLLRLEKTRTVQDFVVYSRRMIQILKSWRPNLHPDLQPSTPQGRLLYRIVRLALDQCHEYLDFYSSFHPDRPIGIFTCPPVFFYDDDPDLDRLSDKYLDLPGICSAPECVGILYYLATSNKLGMSLYDDHEQDEKEPTVWSVAPESHPLGFRS